MLPDPAAPKSSAFLMTRAKTVHARSSYVGPVNFEWNFQ